MMTSNPNNPLDPKLQRTLLAEFRQEICTSCVEFDHTELKCTMVDIHSKRYYSDPAFDCPIGNF